MTKVKFEGLEFEPYISSTQIDAATKRIAVQIDKDYNNCTQMPILLITLNGAMPWAAQLISHLKTQFEWAFVKCASYGENLASCGCVNLQVPPTVSLEGRSVLVVEDIIDTGNTWEFLHNYIKQQGAHDIKIASMSLKPAAYKKKLPLHYVALELEDKFIIGNGMDFKQQGRNLKDLYILCK